MRLGRSVERMTLGLGSAAIILGGGGSAQAGPREDINGIWQVRPAYYLFAKLLPEPELQSSYLAQRARAAAANAKGYTRAMSNMLCQGVGGPGMYQNVSPFTIYSGEGRVTIVFENEYNVQPRTFYLNEKVQPDNIFPSYNGHSIAHWEGDTLVVDTVGYNGRVSHRGNWLGQVPHSDQAHITERMTLEDGGKTLAIAITTVDPVYLLKPWTTTLKFDRLPADTERFEVSCEVDLDAFNSLDLKSLADADPEIKRVLDPDQRESDPGLKYIPKPKPAAARGSPP